MAQCIKPTKHKMGVGLCFYVGLKASNRFSVGLARCAMPFGCKCGDKILIYFWQYIPKAQVIFYQT